MVFITHDMRLVAEYADRTVVLCDGAAAFDGKPDELFASPEILARARLRPPPVHEISARLLGEPLLTSAALVERIGAEFAAASSASLRKQKIARGNAGQQVD